MTPRVMVREGAPSTTGLRCRPQSRGWRAFTRHDGDGGFFTGHDDGDCVFTGHDDEDSVFTGHDEGQP